ncbi:glycosyltransferase [Saccharomonospora cyanea]|uniref:Glycosyl transferase, UDP-glucuronosyltransferase n=1 Tax=Saccharomonospora cyanea NA-134 TaxID=882082 RepID=H5XDG6_9PSEU|nr:glycosyltransferase [Saccharomonospora cyanea]EHR60258.1 glycosyl transferase, UDP-glucuronosyltransferase [Saccharomonospora cyanea NA-134]
MKVLILTLGTRGDVQPFVALARQLHQQGHEAVIAAPHRFAAFVRDHGVTFAGVDDGPLRVLDEGSPVADVANGGVRAKLALARALPTMFTQLLRDCWVVASEGAGRGADLVVHNGQIVAGPHLAEKLGIPAVLALPLPMYVPTGAFPWPGQDLPHTLPAVVNRLSYAGMRGTTLMFGHRIDRWREELGLPRRRGRHDPLRTVDGAPAPVLHAVSPHVLPRPADWPATAVMTGYWFLEDTATTPEAQSLPADLDAFLAAGEPPVFVGFGSMSGADPAATTVTVVEAARRVGTRVVLATGWGGLGAVPPSDDVLVVGDVPYHRLLPRVSVVVHHGGAGTTGAAVAAGRPQLVCPYVADQPFRGRRMRALGVAPEPISQRKLGPENLAGALSQALGDRAMATAAAELGRRVRAENGVAAAVRELEKVVGGTPTSPV